jgi:hypothetical protein
MNLQLEPRIDPVLPHPHATCALCDKHTLDPGPAHDQAIGLSSPRAINSQALSAQSAAIPASLVAYTN